MTADTLPHILMADDDEDDCALARRAFKEWGARGILSCVEDEIELMESLRQSERPPAVIPYRKNRSR